MFLCLLFFHHFSPFLDSLFNLLCYFPLSPSYSGDRNRYKSGDTRGEGPADWSGKSAEEEWEYPLVGGRLLPSSYVAGRCHGSDDGQCGSGPPRRYWPWTATDPTERGSVPGFFEPTPSLFGITSLCQRLGRNCTGDWPSTTWFSCQKVEALQGFRWESTHNTKAWYSREPLWS